ADPVRSARSLVSFRVGGWLWSSLLLALLAFLVLYPTFMLLYGALSGTNPVVDGFNPAAISLDNFIEVLANPNVHFALGNFRPFPIPASAQWLGRVRSRKPNKIAQNMYCVLQSGAIYYPWTGNRSRGLPADPPGTGDIHHGDEDEVGR